MSALQNKHSEWMVCLPMELGPNQSVSVSGGTRKVSTTHSFSDIDPVCPSTLHKCHLFTQVIGYTHRGVRTHAHMEGETETHRDYRMAFLSPGVVAWHVGKHTGGGTRGLPHILIFFFEFSLSWQESLPPLLSSELRAQLAEQGYRLVGTHSAVRLSRSPLPPPPQQAACVPHQRWRGFPEPTEMKYFSKK